MEFVWKDHQKSIFRESVEILFDKSVIYVLLDMLFQSFCHQGSRLHKQAGSHMRVSKESHISYKYIIFYSHDTDMCILHLKQEDWVILLFMP